MTLFPNRFLIALPLFLVSFFSVAQTDLTIFREFQFDFSTPGARANGMGRAFVGLADEATAGYSNPAGLSLLDTPELYLEYRQNSTDYRAPRANDLFDFNGSPPTDSTIELDRVGFMSLSFSWRNTKFSAYYVNNLDYRREAIEEINSISNTVEEYDFTYINSQTVRGIRLDTFGFSVARNAGKLDLGISVGMSKLALDFDYYTTLFSQDIFGLSDLVRSEASGDSMKPTLVMGMLYRINPRFRFGFSAKLHPRFVYTEYINNADHPEVVDPDGFPTPITFKIPDSYQLGFGYQPNDRWTILLDIDWVRYAQLLDDMTLISRLPFKADDYRIGEQPDFRLGGEFFIPNRKFNLALRGGAFLDHDHKTRFIGKSEDEDPIYAIQDFIFNSDAEENNLGYTLGLGVVFNNKLQWDTALVRSDRIKRVVSSLLYRF